jgi:hypothetical protein
MDKALMANLSNKPHNNEFFMHQKWINQYLFKDYPMTGLVPKEKTGLF